MLQTSAVVVVPPEHDQPVTGPDQSAFQPEVLSVSLSSHTSEPYKRPSPQIGLHEEVTPTAPVQEYPVSIVHVLLHPSPLTTLLSSHASNRQSNVISTDGRSCVCSCSCSTSA